MDEINKDIFNEIRQYIQNKEYILDEISETSIRGIIREEFWIHLFYDWKYYDYLLNITLDGYQHINISFNIEDNILKVKDIYSRTQELNDDIKSFKNLKEVIKYINDNTELNI